MKEVLNNLKAQQHKADYQHKTILWIIGVAVVILGAIITFVNK